MDFYTLGKRLAPRLMELIAETEKLVTTDELYSLCGNGAGMMELTSGLFVGLTDLAGWMEAGDRP